MLKPEGKIRAIFYLFWRKRMTRPSSKISDNSDKITAILMRHGRTDSSVREGLLGSETQSVRDTAREILKRGLNVDLIICSNEFRSIETACYHFSALRSNGCNLNTIMTDERLKWKPSTVNGHTIPMGENIRQVLSELSQQDIPPKTVVVISHRDEIRNAAKQLTGKGSHVEHTYAVHIESDEKNWGNMATTNDNKHLGIIKPSQKNTHALGI